MRRLPTDEEQWLRLVGNGGGMVWRILLGIVIVLALASGGFYWWQSRPELPALAQSPTSDSFPREQIQRGAQLAALGDCTTCHTAPGGKSFAGGLPVSTPFGRFYSTNITPDRDRGIGSWPEDAFRRALREGVGRKGTHYYPAFPYDHFTKATDDDIAAIYAFLMTREPVQQQNKSAQLIFPLNWRIFAAAWQVFFLHPGPSQQQTAQNADLNRGAYLVASIGHCGACHTPRDVFGAEETKNKLGGGVSENWNAPALNESSPAPVPWTADQLYAYLRNGFADKHGIAGGPMQPVTANMRKLREADVRAIAVYVASIAGPQDNAAREQQTRQALQFAQARETKVAAGEKSATTGAADSDNQNANANTDGALIFAGACASCHHEGGQLPVSRPLPLALSSVVNEPSPNNLIRIVLDGIHPSPGERGPIMPGFDGALTDQQLTALATYVRQQYSQKPAWQNVEKTVSNARRRQTAERGSR